MKTKIALKKVWISPALLVILFLLVLVSCKKKEDDPVPVPPTPPTPPVPGQVDVFQNKPIHMMSENEISNNLDFPGHIINRLGCGIAGGEDPEIPNPLKEVGKTLWEIYDYEDTKMHFDQIDQGIQDIISQITQLQDQLTNLAKQLSLSLSDLENFMTNSQMNTYVVNIKNAMDPSIQTGFGWFVAAAKTHQEGGSIQQFQNDTAGLHTLAYNLKNREYNYDVITYYTQMNALICPPLGNPQDNALKTYADYLIQHVQGLNDSASLMACYMVFENYFLQVINYQFQCALMYANAANYFDSTGAAAKSFYTGTFTSDITMEVATYLSTVEYLAINLNDYRSIDRYQADYLYNQSGLAPDNLFLHVLARSQFIANLLYDALGLPYPVMCGTIITPWNYTNGNSPVIDSISLSSLKQLNSTATTMQSQFPYTYWVLGNSSCAPDNQWNVYRFGKMGAGDGGWPCSPQSIQVIDNGNGEYPWEHYQPCKGNVTPLFYNPRDPSKTSTTYTDSCYIQFGYFSARWNWGYQYITMRNGYFLRPQYMDILRENENVAQDPFNPPGAATTSSDGHLYQHSNSQGWSWLHSNLGGFGFSNNTVSTDHYYLAGDILYCDIATSSDLPEISGGVQLFGMTSSQYNGQNGLMKVYLGSQIYSDNSQINDPVSSSRDLVTSVYGNSGSWVTGTGTVNLSAGKSYQPSAEVYYQAYNVGTTGITFSTYHMMQVVYTGTYNIFD